MRLFALSLLLLTACDGGASEPPPVCPQIVIAPQGEVRLAVGAQAELVAIEAESGTPASDLIWTAADPGVIDVLDEGVVVGTRAGATEVLVENACGSRAGAPVRVTDRITIEPTSLELKEGASTPLVARGGDGTDVTQDAAWSVADEAVATVADDATVTAVAVGESTVRARWQGLVAEARLTVVEPEDDSGTIEWALGQWVAQPSQFQAATREAPAVASLGSCGQASSNHIWLAASAPAAPPGQRFGWSTVRVRVISPDPSSVPDFRSHLVFRQQEDGGLFAAEVEWRTPGYDPEAWAGRTIEISFRPDDTEFRRSAVARFRRVDRMTRDNLCCEPGDCP